MSMININVYCPSTKQTIKIENLTKDSSIYDLKRIIYDKTGTPPEHQIIQLNNKKIPNRYDSKKWEKLGINENTNIEMIYAMEGGCVGCRANLCCCGGSCRCQIM
ncbi:hypothetical protein CYY_009973 [Polysphondylium violaceum]|uniref:Ubiquitin-like domain-containing protein n=1 Tax=Polysphondylium violaceum TaxID=133409 RepID=A0A8J4PKW4_9MYCE|nr:hypothetical protein CYY_009973 [Polysphondylium violaceum]